MMNTCEHCKEFGSGLNDLISVYACEVLNLVPCRWAGEQRVRECVRERQEDGFLRMGLP